MIRKRALNLHFIDMFRRDPEKLDSAENRNASETEPRGCAAAQRVDDSDQRRGDGSCQTARAHGHSVDAAQDERTGRCVLEQNQRARENNDAVDVLQYEGKVDARGYQILRES